MNLEILSRLACTAAFSVAAAWSLFSDYQLEQRRASGEVSSRYYDPYIVGYALPLFLLLLPVLFAIFSDITAAAKMTLSVYFGIFLQIAVYYLLLLPALPFLRRHVNARACAVLWTLPSILCIAACGFMYLPEPWLVIAVPARIAWGLFFLWLAGFLAVLTWKIAEHLRFRRRILARAVPVSDPQTISIWRDLLQETRIKAPKFKLVTSPDVSNPLSVGLFQRTIRVVLPKRDYDAKALRLILQHELIHVARRDSSTKFFLVFCTAVCWFNPLMWTAMRKSAEDIERSCDEAVLLTANESTRRQYATVLLDAAGDARGFTTCLSASAESMRYRLHNITKPGKHSSGALIVGLICFMLFVSSGYITLAYGGQSGADIVYGTDDVHQYRLNTEEEITEQDRIAAETALHDYLAGLTLYEFSGNYSFAEMDVQFDTYLETPDGRLAILFYDEFVHLVYFRDDLEARYYYVPGGLDLTALTGQ